MSTTVEAGAGGASSDSRRPSKDACPSASVGSRRPSKETHKNNNLGVGFSRRYRERRAESAQLENVISRNGRRIVLRGSDGEIKEFEVVHESSRRSLVTERFCPVLPEAVAIVCATLCIIPGLGTWCAALCSLCCSRPSLDAVRTDSAAAAFGVQLLVGLVQLVTAPLLVGFFWSFKYGMTLVRKSRYASVAAAAPAVKEDLVELNKQERPDGDAVV